MTAPYQPQVVRAPDSDVGAGLAPLIQAIQFKQHLESEAKAQHQRILAETLAQGLRTPGFELSDTMKQLETELGAPGLGVSIAKARKDELNRQIANIKDVVDNASGLPDVVKSAAKASMIMGVHGATTDIQNEVFAKMAGPEALSDLERMRLEQLRAETERINLQIEKMRREPGPKDQETAARILHVNPDDPTQFVQGMNYIGILEDQMKQKELDPAKSIFTGAISIMAQNRDIYGNPSLTPEQAWSASLNIGKNAFPKTASQLSLTPETTQALAATHDGLQVWNTIKANGNSYKRRDGTEIKFHTTKEIRAFVEDGMKVLYPLTTDEQRQNILDIVQRKLYSTFPQ